MPVTLFRSLIFCHSTTSDDCSDESQAGSMSDDFRAWIPGWKAGATSANRAFLGKTENQRWSKAQPSTAENTRKLAASLRENKRSIRRSFSVKVSLQETPAFSPLDQGHLSMITSMGLVLVFLFQNIFVASLNYWSSETCVGFLQINTGGAFLSLSLLESRASLFEPGAECWLGIIIQHIRG